jgi:type I restriction enzyme M protein
VKADEIRKNKYDLSISRYKTVEHKVVEYEKPENIMSKILVLEEEIVGYVKEIKKGL